MAKPSDIFFCLFAIRLPSVQVLGVSDGFVVRLTLVYVLDVSDLFVIRLSLMYGLDLDGFTIRFRIV